jgi:FdhD protein
VKPASAISETAVRRIRSSAGALVEDTLAVEEPLEIRLGFDPNANSEHRPISITMRTPGSDLELAAGFLFTEGIIKDHSDVVRIRPCGLPPPGKPSPNTVVVELAAGIEIDVKRLERNFYTTSSCGVCGKSSIEALHTGAKKLPECHGFEVSANIIHSLPARIRTAQRVFDSTGGLHAAALFDLSGALESVYEDVGRHNALDKLIGNMFMSGQTPLHERMLLVSGRASFELVQKALMAGIPLLAAVGAPSSLAVELAEEFGMTLVGFLRDERFNIYCHGERIV